MATKKYYKRAFLNPKKGVASFEAKYEKHEGAYNAEGNLKITDCNHAVNLELGWYDAPGKKDAEAKLATLIKELVALQVFLFPKEQNAPSKS